MVPRSQKLKPEDAISFLDQMQSTLSDQPELFKEFLGLMKSFKETSIPESDAVSPIVALFRGYPELLAGVAKFFPLALRRRLEQESVFGKNTIMPGGPPTVVPVFSPQDYMQDLSPAGVRFRKNEARCATLFQKEKNDLHNQPKVHQEFLHIMKEFYHKGIKSPETLEHIGQLFQGCPEMIANFNEFLPYENRIVFDPNKKTEVISPERDSGGEIDSSIVHNKQPCITIHLPHNFASNHFSHEMPNSLPENSVKFVYSSEISKAHQQQSVKDEDLCFKLVESTFGNLVLLEFIDIIMSLKSRRIDALSAIYQVLRLFQGHLDIVGNLNIFLPPGYRVEVRPNELTNITENSSSYAPLCDSFQDLMINRDGKK